MDHIEESILKPMKGIVLLVPFVLLQAAHSLGCIGTVKDLAAKISAPDKVHREFKDQETWKNIYALGNWVEVENEGSDKAWQSTNVNESIKYRLIGPNSSCIHTVAVMGNLYSGDVPEGILESNLNLLDAMKLVAYVCKVPEEIIKGNIIIKLLEDLKDSPQSIVRKNHGSLETGMMSINQAHIFIVKKWN